MVIRKDIRAIIFDLDGTIFHLKIDWETVKTKLNQLLGEKNLNFDQIARKLSESENQKAAEYLEQAEIQGVTAGIETSNASNVLRDLNENYQLAVVTRNSRHAAQKVIDKYNLSNVLIVGREDVKKLKPHPEAIELVLRKHNLNKEEVIVVGDTLHDLLAARHLGIKCIIVKNQSLDFIPEGANYYFDNLDGLQKYLRGEV